MIAYVAIGSNLGDRAANIRDAVELMQSQLVSVTSVSELLDNPADGGPPGSPNFLNAVVRVFTILRPRDLLNRLLQIETSMGRIRRKRWEPRIIDLDLLFCDDLTIDEPGLTIPHPRMHERRYVLLPLAQLAPDFVHPKLGKTIQTLLDELPSIP
jgi:2-amino-4-hydroxy-6-hydroxymethyldihydropteridine diphosphokinase